MLQAIQDIYRGGRLRVRAAGIMGPEFSSERGVKQGNPLSPLLFGLLLERIEQIFHEVVDGGVLVGDRRVSMLFNADDLVLLGETPAVDQRALDLLQQCCSCLKMEVNVGKTVGMAMNRRYHKERAVSWMYNGNKVEMRREFKYLGTDFREGDGVGGGWLRLQSSARKAMYGMQCRCGVLGVDSVDLRLLLFLTLVRSVSDFGSAVWGPYAGLIKGVKNVHYPLH